MRLHLSSADYALAIVLLGGGVLFGAEVLEHGAGMAPCPLCLMQRLWLYVAALAAYAGLLHNPRWGIYPLLTIVAALTGSGFALRQLWLQSLPAGQAPSCAAPVSQLLENGMYGEALSAMFFGTGNCTEPDMVLGVNLAVWALLGFAAVIALAVLQWRARSQL